MRISELKDILKDDINYNINVKNQYAINIVLHDRDDLKIVFEERSRKLKAQPGDISFAGGKIEANEAPIQAAIRETVEELEIEEDKLEILTKLGTYQTPFNFLLHIFVSFYNGEIRQVNNTEVERIISVRIDDLLSHKEKSYDLKREIIFTDDFPFDLIEQKENYKFRPSVETTYFYVLNDITIWGITAIMLKNFLDYLKNYFTEK